MKLRCHHGYFIFDEMVVGQLSDFISRTGLELSAKDTYFTFDKLLDAPDYSLKAKPILGVPAKKTFEGSPWVIFEENGLVYDFDKGLVVPIETITQVTTVRLSGNLYVSPGLIQPGSLTADGDRIKSFLAWWSRDRLTWQYSEVEYV